MLKVFTYDAQIMSYYMHEVQGGFCKSVIPRIMLKSEDWKKMIWAETGWATTGEKKKEGALGVASPWALARTVEREEADRAGGSGPGLGSWGPRRCGQRAPGSERLLCSLPSGHGGGGEGSPRGCAKAGRTPGGTGLAGDGCRRPSLGRIWRN